MKYENFVLITDVLLAAHFSGCDVRLIPLIETIETVWGDGPIIKYTLDFENSFLGDDWYIQNEQIYGYGAGPFAIGIPLNKFNAVFCQTKEFENV